jgi:hypothetical protein
MMRSGARGVRSLQLGAKQPRGLTRASAAAKKTTTTTTATASSDANAGRGSLPPKAADAPAPAQGVRAAHLAIGSQLLSWNSPFAAAQAKTVEELNEGGIGIELWKPPDGSNPLEGILAGKGKGEGEGTWWGIWFVAYIHHGGEAERY